eukprot:664828-Pyramimonas_sp.AAC.1
MQKPTNDKNTNAKTTNDHTMQQEATETKGSTGRQWEPTLETTGHNVAQPIPDLTAGDNRRPRRSLIPDPAIRLQYVVKVVDVQL